MRHKSKQCIRCYQSCLHQNNNLCEAHELLVPEHQQRLRAPKRISIEVEHTSNDPTYCEYCQCPMLSWWDYSVHMVTEHRDYTLTDGWTSWHEAVAKHCADERPLLTHDVRMLVNELRMHLLTARKAKA